MLANALKGHSMRLFSAWDDLSSSTHVFAHFQLHGYLSLDIETACSYIGLSGRRLPLRLWKRHSPTTVVFRTTLNLTRMIAQNQQFDIVYEKHATLGTTSVISGIS